MTWFDAVPVALVSAAWLLLPGLPASYAIGLRGLAAWAIAPLVSVALVPFVAVVGGTLGISWSPVLVIGAAVLTAAVCGLVAFLLRRRYAPVTEPDPRPLTLAAGLGLIPALGLGALAVVRGFGRPDNLSQTYDALFHYNAVAQILDSRNGSSFTIGGLGSTDPTPVFYPAAWHDFASLTVMTTGDTIPVAANLLTAVIAIGVWPLSCVFLARQIFGRSTAALAVTGVVSIGFTAFPWGLLGFGVLWPNALGMAIAPAGLAVILSLTGLAKDDALGKGRAWVLLPVGVLATGFAHPNVLFSLVVLGLFPVGTALVRRALRLRREGRTWRGVSEIGVVVAVLLAVWWWTNNTSNPTFANVRNQYWRPFVTEAQGIGEVVLNSTNGGNALWLLSAVVVVGMAVSLRVVEHRWLVLGHAATATLYILAASLNVPHTQEFTGYWYNDSHRLAAILPITGVPLAVAGLCFLATKLAEATWWRRVATARALGSATAVAIILAVLLAVGAKGMYHGNRVQRILNPYQHPPAGGVLASAEQTAFYARVKDRIPAEAVVANNPWDGSGLLWALADRKTLFPHFTVARGEDQEYLAKHLSNAANDPRVCSYASRLHVEYLLLGGSKFWPGDLRAESYPGFADPESRPGFQLVDSDGGMKLYRITACSATTVQQP